MSLAFEAGRLVGRLGRRLASGFSSSELGTRLDEKWRQAREAFDEGLRGGYSRRRLEELYGRLELPLDADLEAVEVAWRRLVRLYHPDRFADNAQRVQRATELVAALNDARAELKKYLAQRRR